MLCKTAAVTLAALCGALGPVACQQAAGNHNSTGSAQAAVSEKQETAMSADAQAAINALSWVTQADPAADAAKALATGNAELLAFSGRAKSFPGLTVAEYEGVKDIVGYRYFEGMGDVLYGDAHKALRRQARSYATQYNQVIYKAVSQGR